MENQNNLSPGYELVARYFAGEADPEEAMQLDDWRKESSKNEQQMESISTLWQIAGRYNKPDVDLEWNRMQASMQVSGFILKPLLSIAAVVIIVATGLWIALKQPNSTGPKIQFTTVFADTAVKKLRLPDSSRVTLNTGGALTSPEVFATNARSVSLKGEAYFDITPNAAQPFMITVDDVKIKVIGTSFNVNATDSGVQVSVKEGVVMMLIVSDSIIIHKGQSGLYDRKTKHLRLVERIDINAIAYATNYFHFENVTLGEAKKALERAFKIDIIFTNPLLANCRIVGLFDNESIDQILNTLAITFDAKFKIEGKIAYFTGDGCPQNP